MDPVTEPAKDRDKQTSVIDETGPFALNQDDKPTGVLRVIYVSLVITILFLNYFLAQYDKFVLSYFQAEVISSLRLTSTDYGVLSGYATGIAYAVLALPVAFIADYTQARVWVLSIAALWWSLCVLFQGLSHNFYQILLARIGMGIGQAPVEALSISLISDLVPLRWLFFAESVFYVGVYVGEAVSGQIATAFSKTNTPWNDAMKAIGIAGIVLGVITRLVLREPHRQALLKTSVYTNRPELSDLNGSHRFRVSHAKIQLVESFEQFVSMKSFWILTLSYGSRQFSGNVFGYYMPFYLSSIYTSQHDILSHYGIIVGVVGSVAVVLGGTIASSLPRQPSTTLYFTGIGGMISAPFVICMVFSLSLANGDQTYGVKILYGTMSAAYLTAELWLGAFASLLALLVPPRTKTFCLAIYTSTIILIYSAAPQIIGLSLRNYDPDSIAYLHKTRNILAILIPVGYWVGGIGFLYGIRKLKQDLDEGCQGQEHCTVSGASTGISARRKTGFVICVILLGSLTVALFVTSLVVS